MSGELNVPFIPNRERDGAATRAARREATFSRRRLPDYVPSMAERQAAAGKQKMRKAEEIAGYLVENDPVAIVEMYVANYLPSPPTADTERTSRRLFLHEIADRVVPRQLYDDFSDIEVEATAASVSIAARRILSDVLNVESVYFKVRQSRPGRKIRRLQLPSDEDIIAQWHDAHARLVEMVSKSQEIQ